jgi:predicted lysophospholipase L1 biosynthesis ABC-type transport system permease subunit
MGLDIFSSSYMTGEMDGTFDMSALALLVEPNTVLVPYVMAERMDVAAGDMITVYIGGLETQIKVIGNVGKEDDSKIDGLLVADISTAQEL